MSDTHVPPLYPLFVKQARAPHSSILMDSQVAENSRACLFWKVSFSTRAYRESQSNSSQSYPSTGPNAWNLCTRLFAASCSINECSKMDNQNVRQRDTRLKKEKWKWTHAGSTVRASSQYLTGRFRLMLTRNWLRMPDGRGSDLTATMPLLLPWPFVAVNWTKG